jgi:hypothetical protein
MSTELVRRAKVLRLCREILGNNARSRDIDDLITAIEQQDSLIEGLSKFEGNLANEITPAKNVIPLKRKKANDPPISQLKLLDKRFIIETPCLIEGSDELERKKLAFEIHSRTRKSVFIDIIQAPSLWDAGVEGLEDSTIYVSHLENLYAFDQDKLEGVVSRENAPLVIAATNLSYTGLKNHRGVSASLLDKLAQAHFRLQRPLKEYLELGFFKLFLESLG